MHVVLNVLKIRAVNFIIGLKVVIGFSPGRHVLTRTKPDRLYITYRKIIIPPKITT